MYGDITLCDFKKPTSATSVQGYNVHINSYWVRVNKCDEKGKVTPLVVFKREASDPEWYDETHRKITSALQALENALLEAVREGEQKLCGTTATK